MRALSVSWFLWAIVCGVSGVLACSDAGVVPFVAGDVGGAGGAGAGAARAGPGGASVTASCGDEKCDISRGESCSTCKPDCCAGTGGSGGTSSSIGGSGGSGGIGGSSGFGGTGRPPACGNGSCDTANRESCRTCEADCCYECPTDWAYSLPECDVCMRTECCDWLRNCDSGTSCRLVDDCRFSHCTSSPDLRICMNDYCSDWGTGALSQWFSYYGCLQDYCSGACSR